MKREHIEQMISHIDENYVAEAIREETQAACKASADIRLSYKIKKWAVAAAFCAIVLGTGISVTAATSDAFHDWLTKILGGHEITQVEITPEQTPVEDTSADLPADEDSHLSLAENTEIFGETESFVCQYHMADEKMIMDEIYSIQGNGLKRLQTKNFHGTYNGVDFSFEYAVINNEIFGCNLSGNINEVFHYTDGETAYAQLCEMKEDVFIKSSIARLNLKTGTVEKLTDDKAPGNMVMSPTGKMILIDYRMDGYWAAFDIDSRTEKKLKEIRGYTRTSEVIFLDDYHVLTYGDIYIEGNREIMRAKVIDLKTDQQTASYKKSGDRNPQWIYKYKKNRLTIQHVDGTVAIQIDGVKKFPHPLSYRGSYVLLKNLEEAETPYYLCNLKEKTYMTIDPPPGLSKNVEIYLAAKEEKILLTDGKEAYLVNIKD